MKYDLLTPVTLPDGSIVKSVILRNARMKDVRAVQKLIAEGETFDAAMAIIASIVGLPLAFAEELDTRDFEHLAELAKQYSPHLKEASHG